MTNIYRLALQVQDASNPSGVVNSLANEIMPGIRDEVGYREQGTAYVTSHPAFILFLDKLASMTGKVWLYDTNSAVSQAYEVCNERAKDPNWDRVEVQA
jgi:hypothetical protein